MSGPEPSERRSDQRLVEAVNRGDVSAFEELYRRYRDWVVSLAYRFTDNREDALDVLQETFAYLLGKFPGFRLEAKMTTFLYPAVKHLALAARGKSRRYTGGGGDLQELAASTPRAMEAAREELGAVVASLPEGQREVLLLRFVDGLILEEIAAALEIPLGTVKSRLHKALAALRNDGRTRRYFYE